MASAQTGVSASSTSATAITVSWTNPGGYLYQELQYQTPYEGWTTESSSIGAGSTSYSFTATTNVEYYFRMRGQDSTTEVWSAWSETSNACTCAADTVVKTLELSGSSEDVVSSTSVSDTSSKTINFSGYSLDAQSITTEYAYYVADSTGAVYEYSPDYKSDGGTAIPCYWQSKETNFTDQYKELENRQKNVHYARLYYKDLDSSMNTSVKISTDGGATWAATSTKSIGTGDGKNKSSDFYFTDGAVSGQIFTIRVSHTTSDSRIQLTGIALYFEPGGEDFNI